MFVASVRLEPFLRWSTQNHYQSKSKHLKAGSDPKPDAPPRRPSGRGRPPEVAEGAGEALRPGDGGCTSGAEPGVAGAGAGARVAVQVF